MAAATTSTGPISIEQINQNLYVGQGDLTTIQKAVDYARNVGGLFTVTIPYEYAGSDTIASVTGGTSSVMLLDLRNQCWQAYVWSSGAYVPADFDQKGNVFVATLGVDGVATVVGELHAYGGIETEEIFVGQAPVVDGAKVLLIGTNPGANEIQLQGETYGGAYDQTLLLNPSGGAVQIGSGVSFDHAGNITTTGNITAGTATINGDLTTTAILHAANATITGDLTATDAQFATCEVANSPVRTFANTADAPAGMIWPPLGIAVSAGSAWGTSINPATLTPYPPAGIPQSTGTAWGAPIAVANVPLLNAANTFSATVNTFNGYGSFGGGIHLTGYGTIPPTPNTGNIGFSGGTVYFDCFGPNPTTQGNALFRTLTGDGSSPTSVLTILASGIYVAGMVTAGTTIRLGARGTGLPWQTGTPNINSDPSNIFINGSSASGGVFFNWDQGSTGVHFGNGAGAAVGTLDGSGNFNVNGTISSSGAKSFRIPHPLDETKELWHACLEGPEVGVFYRGEAVTKDGTATVTLPDYFEALTAPTDRTVLLTQIFEDDSKAVIGSNTFSMLMASRVKDGKFSIRSSEKVAKVYWEVKAIRAGVEPLWAVTTLKEKLDAITPHGRPDAGTERDGTPEAGEPQPEKVRTGGSGPGSSNRTRKPH